MKVKKVDECSFLTCVSGDITVCALVLLQREPGQVQPGHYLHGVLLLPLVDEVILGPSICKEQVLYHPKRALTPVDQASLHIFCAS